MSQISKALRIVLAFAAFVSFARHSSAAIPISDLVVQRTAAFQGDTVATALSANTNDWAPTDLATSSILYASASGANRNLTGLTGGADGRVLTLFNAGATYSIVVKNADTGSTAANRFALAADYTILPGAGVELIYDPNVSRWRIRGNQTAPSTATVTNSTTLTSNALVLGDGTSSTKVAAGFTTDGTSKLILGVAGTSVGSLDFKNATSGTLNIAPPTGALGTINVTLPNASSTLPIFGQQITFTGPTAARSIALPDAAFTVARTDAAQTFTGTQTFGVVLGTTFNGVALTTGGGTTNFLRADGSYAAPPGSGTVTNTGGNLTSNSVVLGAGTTDSKVVAGITTDGTSQINLGVASTTLGKLKLFGSTSGDATIQTPVAAGTATVVTLPNASSTLPIFGQQITFTGPTAARSIALPDAAFTVARTDAAQTFTGNQTFSGNIAVGGATVSSSTGLITPVGTTTLSSLRIPHGAAPTSPVDGDFWTTSAGGLFGRINGATINYGAGGGGGSGTVNSGTANSIPYYATTGTAVSEASILFVNSSVFRVTSATYSAPASGKGLELLYNSALDTGTIYSYDRTGTAYKPLEYNTSSHTFKISGTTLLTFTTSGIGFSGGGFLAQSPGATPAIDFNGDFRILSAAYSPPTTGKGVEIVYNSGSDVGIIYSYDRTGAAYKPMEYSALSHTLKSGSTAILTVSSTAVTANLSTNATTTSDGALRSSGGLSVINDMVIGGLIKASSSIKSISATAGIGYGTGAGGTVTQATDKSTGVTLNKVTGQITMNNASLAAATSVSFTLTNSAIAATDVVIVNIGSGATAASYTVTVDAVAAGSCRIHLRNESAGSLGEALVLNFAVIKGVTS